ncbi:MAG: hypothetical protein AB1706_10170 [Pseudomonadota bacterium]
MSLVSQNRILVGGSDMYVGPVITNKASLPAMRNVGTIRKEDSVDLNYTYDKIQIRTGTPSKLVDETIITEDLSLQTALVEVFSQRFAEVFNATPTYTNGTVNTTVATDAGNTASKFKLTAFTGVEDKQHLAITLASTGVTHYRYVEDVDASYVYLDEALPETPAVADVVKNVTKTEIVIGAATTVNQYGLKLIKNHPKLNKKYTLIIFKAAINTQNTISFKDDDYDPLPFGFTAYSDPDVESGALAVLWEEDLA